ncbi:MAG: beta-N-acetylhexosaminidase, partial [Saprospiraceae bacterium]
MLRIISCLLVTCFLFFSCNNDNAVNTSPVNVYNIIPQPTNLNPQEGQFVIDKNTTINIPVNGDFFKKEAIFLQQSIDDFTGRKLPISTKTVNKNVITFVKNDDLPKEESYELKISPEQIIITAGGDAGAFYALQTIQQLIIPQSNQTIAVPAVEIKDSPRFAYRGMHLDVARHFFPVETVKRYIDLIAYHKLNRFHWHLTEDQGWRIEIKKYPKLTEIGGFRNGTLVGHYNDQPHQFDGKRYGGFYTQAEVKEVVAYATERHITVIPEIEMPGHSQAALTAYPELACTDGPFEVATKWGVFSEVYCPSEQTFEFLEDVLTEVMALFPSKYIHIGGDECPKTRWKESAFCQQLIKENGLKDEHGLQSYFIKRIEKFLNENGRDIIGWDEILEGGLAPNATVMSWRGIEGGIQAAKAGHDVIMTPTSHCYFDYYQSDHPDEPLAIGGFLPLEKVYHYEPIPEELNAAESKYILGTQANLWTEYIPSQEKLDYMVFPRLSALAEVAWSARDARDFTNFTQRLIPHMNRLEAMGVNVANHLYDLKSSIQSNGKTVTVELSKLAQQGNIYYTLDGSTPTPSSTIYSAPIVVSSNAHIKAQT